ncbi:MAG: aldehyde dehydrogenase family protein [Alphaproteobacteria bacterium]
MSVMEKDKAGKITRTDLWIGGKSVPPSSGRYFEDHSPIDNRVYSEAAEGTIEDVDRAVRAAHEAFASYGKTLAKDREVWLFRAAELMERRKEEVIDILIDEVGSPITKCMFEVDMSVRMFRAAAGVPRRLTGKTIPSDRPGCFSMSVREPVGVVAGITPFNVPLVKAAKQASVALACGNTFVLMPSEEAPLVASWFARILHDAGFPAGSFNVVTGNPFDIGDSLTSHPLVKSVLFCGSTRVGRHIAEICGRDLKPVTLELGGKSPAIILKDADLDVAVPAAAAGIFFFQGQACMGTSRMIVERAIADEFITRFTEVAKGMKIGDLRQPDTAVGPIISDRQRERVKTHIDDAVAKGARMTVGGNWAGNVCEPTVLTGVTPDMVVYAEETFGPVTAIYIVDGPEEALKIANDTSYGLSAAIFTNNVNNAFILAQGIHAGMVHVNAASLQDEPHVPFGGMGQSGLGREGTETDIEAMTEWKWITVQLPVEGGGH